MSLNLIWPLFLEPPISTIVALCGRFAARDITLLNVGNDAAMHNWCTEPSQGDHKLGYR